MSGRKKPPIDSESVFEEYFGPLRQAMGVGQPYAARLVLRPQGAVSDDPDEVFTMVVGVIHGDPRHPQTIKGDEDEKGKIVRIQDELLLCTINIKPVYRFIGHEAGLDAGGLLVRGGLYPGNWERQVEGKPYRGQGGRGDDPEYDPYKP